MRYEFTPVCETGIKLIDDEHRKFFSYINAIFEALEQEPEDVALATAKNVLVKLEEYAMFHFNDEEEYMREHKDAELVLQIIEHEKFRKDFAKLKEGELTRDKITELANFMAKWLYKHILTSDTLIGHFNHPSRFEFTKDFYTDVDFVNEQHANLFAIINRGWDVLEDDMIFDKYDKVVGILNELRVYTQRHFADEEAHMEKINYEGLPAQRAVHEAFIDKVVNLDLTEIEDMDEDQNTYLGELLEFLNDWLINHILRMDKKIPNA